jgi:hypothetical protein
LPKHWVFQVTQALAVPHLKPQVKSKARGRDLPEEDEEAAVSPERQKVALENLRAASTLLA